MVSHNGLPITIGRETPTVELSPFTDYFKGFERVQAVRKVFGRQTDDILGNLRVGFVSHRYMYMGVRDSDGNLSVGTYHLKNSDMRTLYLDVVHELFHVKQFMADKQYFRREHRRYLKNGFNTSLYFKSPIEVPAYKHAVEEAKRIGMSYDEIVEYLEMGPVDPKVFSRLLKDVGLDRGMSRALPERPHVKINRNARVPLYNFNDFFKGFEQVGSLKKLFGSRTGEVLAGLKVEFSGIPIDMITFDETDGHLQVSIEYLKKGDERLLYTDILACLNMLKGFSERKSTTQSEDRQLFDSSVLAESYKAAIKEAKRLGLSDAELVDHLSIPRFRMTPEEFRRFLDQIGLGRMELKS
jgi:hypothetical protein